jgi:hypothetical protein
MLIKCAVARQQVISDVIFVTQGVYNAESYKHYMLEDYSNVPFVAGIKLSAVALELLDQGFVNSAGQFVNEIFDLVDFWVFGTTAEKLMEHLKKLRTVYPLENEEEFNNILLLFFALYVR